MKLYSAVNEWRQCNATLEEVYRFLRGVLAEGDENEIRTLIAWLPNIVEMNVYKDTVTVFFKNEKEGVNLAIGIEEKFQQWINEKE